MCHHRSRVIDSLRNTPEKLVYFYCNRAEENRREPTKVLATLIQQLAQPQSEKDPGLLTQVVNIYKDRGQKGQKSAHLSLAECRDLLVQIIDTYPQTTICIDAMDEVDNDTRIDLLKCLKHVIIASKNVVKIFVTTRMDTDILIQFEIFPRIELQPDDNVGDINGFVRTKVQSMIDDRLLLHGKVSNELQDEICTVLCQRCKGKYACPNPWHLNRFFDFIIYYAYLSYDERAHPQCQLYPASSLLSAPPPTVSIHKLTCPPIPPRSTAVLWSAGLRLLYSYVLLHKWPYHPAPPHAFPHVPPFPCLHSMGYIYIHTSPLNTPRWAMTSHGVYTLHTPASRCPFPVCN